MLENIKKLSVKDKIAYSTCLLSFIIGWGLVIAGFIVDPLGIVDNSIQFILGQSLLYTASVLGLGMYVDKSVRHMKHQLGIDKKNNEEEEYE